MLSRRNIRIKVLQSLYAASMAPDTSPEQLYQDYTQSCQKSYKLLLFTLSSFIRLTSFALKEEGTRSAKLLSTEDDSLYTPILYTNPLTQSLVRNKFLQTEISQQKVGEIKDEDILRQVYGEFSKSEDYLAYWKDNKDHMAILLKFLKASIANPLFEELLDDYSPAWIDDKSLIIGTLKKIIKALPLDDPFYEEYRPDKDLIEEFGRNMLLRVWNRNDDLTESIGPTLKNWDVNRVATLDMIMLKMAVCELMYFPTIPPKVTLNEFVEIAKIYSTDKSKEFVNGILDRLMKDLVEAGKINKLGRGLVE